MSKLEDAINEIKNLAKEFRERNGNSVLRIPNKDFNLWIVDRMLKQDGRITKIEVRQKTFLTIGLAAIPIAIFFISLLR